MLRTTFIYFYVISSANEVLSFSAFLIFVADFLSWEKGDILSSCWAKRPLNFHYYCYVRFRGWKIVVLWKTVQKRYLRSKKNKVIFIFELGIWCWNMPLFSLENRLFCKVMSRIMSNSNKTPNLQYIRPGSSYIFKNHSLPCLN